jgi:hypothetical protein
MSEVIYSGCNLYNQYCYYKEGDSAKEIILNNISKLLKKHSLDTYKSKIYLKYLISQIEESIYLLDCVDNNKTIIIRERFNK